MVEKYWDTLRGELVAVKSIPPPIIQQETKRVLRELDLMAFLSDLNPFVITSDCIFATPAHHASSSLNTPNTLGTQPVEYLFGHRPNVIPPSSASFNPTSSPSRQYALSFPQYPLDVSSEFYIGLAEQERPVYYLRALLQLACSIRLDDGPPPRELYGAQGGSHPSALRRHAASLALQLESGLFYLHLVMPCINGDLLGFTRLLTAIHSTPSPVGPSPTARPGALPPAYLSTSSAVLAFQLSCGLRFIHACGILHRDVKPENVLVDLHPTDPTLSHCLLADFGLARDNASSGTSYVCTRCYRGPELITQIQKASSASDVWSMGCVFYELCTGMTLFTMASSVNENGMWDGGMASQQLEVVLNIVGTPPPADIHKYTPEGSPKQYLLNCQPRPSLLEKLLHRYWKLTAASDQEKYLWYDLISRCLAFYPAQRPTAESVCQHPLFRYYHLAASPIINPPRYRPSHAPLSAGMSVHKLKQEIVSLVSHSLLQKCREEEEALLMQCVPAMDESEDEVEFRQSCQEEEHQRGFAPPSASFPPHLMPPYPQPHDSTVSEPTWKQVNSSTPENVMLSNTVALLIHSHNKRDHLQAPPPTGKDNGIEEEMKQLEVGSDSLRSSHSSLLVELEGFPERERPVETPVDPRRRRFTASTIGIDRDLNTALEELTVKSEFDSLLPPPAGNSSPVPPTPLAHPQVPSSTHSCGSVVFGAEDSSFGSQPVQARLTSIDLSAQTGQTTPDLNQEPGLPRSVMRGRAFFDDLEQGSATLSPSLQPSEAEEVLWDVGSGGPSLHLETWIESYSSSEAETPHKSTENEECGDPLKPPQLRDPYLSLQYESLFQRLLVAGGADVDQVAEIKREALDYVLQDLQRFASDAKMSAELRKLLYFFAK